MGAGEGERQRERRDGGREGGREGGSGKVRYKDFHIYVHL